MCMLWNVRSIKSRSEIYFLSLVLFDQQCYSNESLVIIIQIKKYLFLVAGLKISIIDDKAVHPDQKAGLDW